MLHSIASVSISGTLEEKLHAIARAGFAGVEIFEADLLAAPHSAAEVGAMMCDLGLACTAFQPFRHLEGLPEPLRARTFDRLERKFETMQALGTDVLLSAPACRRMRAAITRGSPPTCARRASTPRRAG